MARSEEDYSGDNVDNSDMEEDFVEDSDEELEGLLSNSDEDNKADENSNNNYASSDDGNDSDTFVRKRKIPYAKRMKQKEEKQKKKSPERVDLGLRSRRHVNYCEETYEDILNPEKEEEEISPGLFFCFFFDFFVFII